MVKNLVSPTLINTTYEKNPFRRLSQTFQHISKNCLAKTDLEEFK